MIPQICTLGELHGPPNPITTITTTGATIILTLLGLQPSTSLSNLTTNDQSLSLPSSYSIQIARINGGFNSYSGDLEHEEEPTFFPSSRAIGFSFWIVTEAPTI